jgi:hypothetical protein
MDSQNITLSLPRDLLQKAKLVAVQQETSVSRLLTQLLEDLVNRETGYMRAKEQSLALLRDGFDLSTAGRAHWRREDLHER